VGCSDWFQSTSVHSCEGRNVRMNSGSSKAKWFVAAGFVAAVVGAIVAYATLLRTHTVPASQRALLFLTPANLQEFKVAFNADVEHPRMIAFLSPT